MWFRHPKPFIQKAVPMQMVKRKSEAPPDTHGITVETGGGSPGEPRAAPPTGPVTDDPIRFSVSYNLRQFLTMLRENIAFEGARRRPISMQGSWYKRVRQPLFGLAVIALAIYATGLVPPLLLAALACIPLFLMMSLYRPALPLVAAVIAPPAYLLHRRRFGVCEYSIDAEVVTRVSAAGTSTQPWSALTEARLYPSGYMLMFGAMALPLPYRCLSAQQVVRIRALLAQVPA